MVYILTVALLLLTGCISEILHPCEEPPTPPIPPVPTERTGKLWLQPGFTMHNQKGNSGEYKDLFSETADRIDIYIFDAESGLLKKVITDQPVSFPAGYRVLPELPAGSYEAVAWVNLGSKDATLIQPDAPQTGVTTLTEMQVKLAEKRNITRQPVPQLWGKSTPFTIDTLGFEQDTIVPIRLIRDTNIIDFTVNWRDKDTHKLCPLPVHADSTRIYIDDANSSVFLADNSLAAADSITYLPTYTSKNAPTLKARSTVMRLLTASAPVLRITRLQADGSEREVYRKNLMKDFIAQAYTMQESLDREELFEIMIEFECEHKKPGPDPNPDPDPDPDPNPNPDPDPNPDPTPDPTPETWIAVRVILNGWILIDDVDIDL